MSDKVDRKMETVFLAEFEYRHEAEFAAGFLDDAGIPYRLQVDDPAMGLTIAAPATLWVLGVDESRARDVLDLSNAGTPLHDWTHDDSADSGELSKSLPKESQAPASAELRSVDRSGVVPSGMSDPPGSAARHGAERSSTGLSLVERALAMVLFAGAAAAAWLLKGSPDAVLWSVVLAVLSVPMGGGAIFGRTIAPARYLLRAMSGQAP